jgi:hypothetical protein
MCKFLQSLRDAVQRKWQRQWFLHHDSAPNHTPLVVQQFLSSIHHTFWISLGMTYVFPTLKMGLKLTHFATMEDMKLNVMAELQKIPNEAFQQWQDCGVCVCVHVGGGVPPLKVMS